MQLFRNLGKNIFFKIFLALLALSFVSFGVSGFILGGSSWVAKIGGKTITQNAFMKEMQKNRDAILQTNSSEEANQYLQSDRFKSDVLQRMVNSVVMKKLREDLGIQASKDLVLQDVARDKSFRGPDGKFDYSLFERFLRKNGLDEKQYVEIIQTEIASSMVIQTLAAASPTNINFIINKEEFKQQTRFADVIKVTNKNIKKAKAPSNSELNKFFEENRKNYAAPEMRKVSYLTFSKKDFAKDMKVSKKEIAAHYEKNKIQFQKPETRDLYHLVFDDKKEATDFAKKLNSADGKNKSKLAGEFSKLAKKTQGKSIKDITLANVSQKDLIPELSLTIFKLSLNESSDAVKSPLGFHVFLLNKITPSKPIALAKVKDEIKNKLLKVKKDTVLQDKVSQIDDVILASNSLKTAANKFSLKISSTPVLIDQTGKNKKGKEISGIKSLENFAANAFSTPSGQTTKIFYSKAGDEFYAIKVEEIKEARNKDLKEVKSQVLADLSAKIQSKKLQELADQVGAEIKKNPKKASRIAAKYRLSVDKNKEFPRTFYFKYQDRQLPYASEFLKELFDLKISQATGVNSQGSQEFNIGILRSINQPSISDSQIEKAKEEAKNDFRKNVAQGYNSFMMRKYPVQVNEQFFANKEE